jgi:hypothetical protein
VNVPDVLNTLELFWVFGVMEKLFQKYERLPKIKRDKIKIRYHVPEEQRSCSVALRSYYTCKMYCIASV